MHVYITHTTSPTWYFFCSARKDVQNNSTQGETVHWLPPFSCQKAIILWRISYDSYDSYPTSQFQFTTGCAMVFILVRESSRLEHMRMATGRGSCICIFTMRVQRDWWMDAVSCENNCGLQEGRRLHSPAFTPTSRLTR